MGYSIKQYTEILKDFPIKAKHHFDSEMAEEVISRVNSISLGYMPRFTGLDERIYTVSYDVDKTSGVYARHTKSEKLKQKELTAFYKALKDYLGAKSEPKRTKQLVLQDLSSQILLIKEILQDEVNEEHFQEKDVVYPSQEKLKKMKILSGTPDKRSKHLKLEKVLRFRFNSPILTKYLEETHKFDFDFTKQVVIILDKYDEHSSKQDVFISYLHHWNKIYRKSMGS